VDDAALVEHAAGSVDFFTNPWEAECGIITTCSIKAVGCTDAYTGDKLTIDAASGKIESL
jgi:hypothetical protein